MERRVLLAVVLSFVVLYAYQAMFPVPQKPAEQKPAQPSKVATAPNAAAPEPANPTPSIQPPAEALPGAATAAREIVVENGDLRAVFTTRGAAIKSWQLKKYRDSTGQPYEMVAGHAPPDSPLPLTLAVDDAALAKTLASAVFAVASESGDGTRGWQARFDYSAGGVTVQKTFSIAPDKPYLVNVAAAVTRDGQQVPATVRWGPALGRGVTPSASFATYSPPIQPIFYRDGEVTRVKPDQIAAQPVAEGTFGFIGVDDHYFLTALVKPAQPVRVDYQPVHVPVPDAPDGAKYVAWSARFPGAAQGAAFFAGPKDFDVLAGVDRELVRAIDFGMFAWLVVPLLRALKWINGYVGNYGWSLILLTILINLAMFPLRHKSVVSMRKMQEVQPEVKAIQDRYAKLKMSDPARGKMNQELMALYKERGVNPASGCVPMLLTLPVLFAFYSMLSVAIELRGAPFVGQIHDLSAHDPWFIWPILMGITMFIQQKMTPSTADPVQQRIMLIMPVMMSGMFLWAASGLVIYWTVSNTWGILQQMVTNRLIGPTAVRTVRPPAERRVKNAGGGRTDQAKERS
ncbi:MAG TPA: membrane protein insertase YidC [Vicinamibacterales bacterium]|nr:membrane protein insertase YidC [Vicinamibacterales bacterium]